MSKKKSKFELSSNPFDCKYFPLPITIDIKKLKEEIRKEKNEQK